MKKFNPEYIPYCPDGPYSWVVIKYDDKNGFACDWGDCLEQIIFIESSDIPPPYIEFSDPLLTYCEPIMVKNGYCIDSFVGIKR